MPDATQATNTNKSTMDKLTHQPKEETQGTPPKKSTTLDKVEIRAFKNFTHIEEHNETLKNSTTFLMQNSLNTPH